MLSAASGGTETKSALVIIFVVGPAVVVVSIVMFAYGLGEAIGARVEGMPRSLVVVGLVPFVWSLGIQLALASEGLSELLDNRSGSLEQPWPVATALAVAAGLVAICVAIGKCRTNDPSLSEAAMSTAIGIFLVTLVSVGLQQYAKPSSRDSALMLLLLIAVANVVTIVMLARLLSRASRAMRGDGASLPKARVV